MSSSPPPGPHGSHSPRSPASRPSRGAAWIVGGTEGSVAILYLAAAVPATIGFFDALPSPLKAALICAAIALLLLRRRLPRTALLGLAAIAGALPVAGLLTAAAACTAARRTAHAGRRGGLVLTAAALPVLVGVLGSLATGYGGWVAGCALGLLVAGVGVLLPGLAGIATGQQERARTAAGRCGLVDHRLGLLARHTDALETALATRAPDLRDDAAHLRRTTGEAIAELREVRGALDPLGRTADAGESGAVPDAPAPDAPAPRTPPLRAPRRLPGAAAALLGLAGTGALLLFGLAVIENSRTVAESAPDRTDRTVRTGMTRDEVLMAAGPDSDLAGAAAAGREPPRPPGTDCLFPYETHTAPHRSGMRLTRYCFRADVLVDIAEFTVPLAPRTTP